jgi:hypothetical protein
MSEVLQPIIVRGLHRGMADQSVVADSVMPTSQLREILNMDTDSIGVLTRRNGYTRLGSAQVIADNVMRGLFHHISTTSANSQIVAFLEKADDSLTEAYYLSGSTWTNKALAFTAGNKVRNVTFLGYLFAVNGVDAPKSWSGSTGAAWGTTNLVSAPTGSLIETYKQQVYIGDPTTDTVYFSSIPTAGAITWNTTDDNFKINPNDGSKMTAMKRYGQELLIFKKNYLYRFNGNATDADPVLLYGTPSQESITSNAGGCYFFDGNRQNVYVYAGGYPTPIGKPIRAFLKAIPTSSYDQIALYSDDDHVEVNIGTVTVRNVVYTNCSLRYTISTQTWVVRTYAHSFRVFAQYDDGSALYMLGGTSEGSVVKMNTGNDDLATSIPYRIETPWYVIGGNPAYLSRIASLSIFVENAGSLQAQYKTDMLNEFKALGAAKGYVTSWGSINADFHRLKLRFTGYSNADPTIFEGFSVLVPLLEGVEKESLSFNP